MAIPDYDPPIPADMLAPSAAIRASGLDVCTFVDVVNRGELTPIDFGGEVRAFKTGDVEALRDRIRRAAESH